jgi:hypothetical protein
MLDNTIDPNNSLPPGNRLNPFPVRSIRVTTRLNVSNLR